MAIVFSAAALGMMLFFTILVAPVIFKVLPAQWAAVYVRAFFPRYYLALGFMSLAMLLTAQYGLTRALALVCVLSFVFLYAVLTPRINHARDQQQEKAFSRGHLLSVVLNLLQMALMLVCTYLESARLPSV